MIIECATQAACHELAAMQKAVLLSWVQVTIAVVAVFLAAAYSYDLYRAYGDQSGGED